ncbi:uncharacterized protein [Watersipora subatra]|uniref:uncharacterized protein n=1 Tax=Watersipora subatra TaxID=2589382 RepID=UPI00355C3BDE
MAEEDKSNSSDCNNSNHETTCSSLLLTPYQTQIREVYNKVPHQPEHAIKTASSHIINPADLNCWPNSISRIRLDGELNEKWRSIDHHAFDNCFLIAIAAHYDIVGFDPLFIFDLICSHARDCCEYYSLFFPEGKKGFISILDNFEKTGEYQCLLEYLDAVVRITAKALEKHIVVTDNVGLVLYGEKDKPITPDSIVIIMNDDEDISFYGTKLITRENN